MIVMIVLIKIIVIVLKMISFIIIFFYRDLFGFLNMYVFFFVIGCCFLEIEFFFVMLLF